MAEKARTLDVWIVESNMVYRDVPYEVVADWTQQGRLLDNDMLRPTGTTEWQPLGSLPSFSPYLPKPQAHRAEDRAEALEPVEIEMSWRHPKGEEDDDVDMIPLIDVSLVLLIFFMMTAAVTGSTPNFNPPTAGYPDEIKTKKLWIGIVADADGAPVYAVGEGEGATAMKLSEAEALNKLDELLREQEEPVDVTVKADKTLPYGVVAKINEELEKRRTNRKGGIKKTYAGVTERVAP